MHAEMPVHRDASGNKLPDPVGLQLWVDLPKEAKKEPPSYQEYRSAALPTAKPNGEGDEEGFEVKVVVGESHGVESPIKLPKNGGMTFLDITLDAAGTVFQRLDPRYNAFIYTLEGTVVVGDSTPVDAPARAAFGSGTEAVEGEKIEPFHTIVLTQRGEAGVRISNAGGEKARLVLVAGEPLDQEVVQYGPFVMTSRNEIQQTLIDFQTGSNGFERAPGWRSKIGAHMT